MASGTTTPVSFIAIKDDPVAIQQLGDVRFSDALTGFAIAQNWPEFEAGLAIANKKATSGTLEYPQYRGAMLDVALKNITTKVNPAADLVLRAPPRGSAAPQPRGIDVLVGVETCVNGDPEAKAAFEQGITKYVDHLASNDYQRFKKLVLRLLPPNQTNPYNMIGAFITPDHINTAIATQNLADLHALNDVGDFILALKNNPAMLAKLTPQQLKALGRGFTHHDNLVMLRHMAESFKGDPALFDEFKKGIEEEVKNTPQGNARDEKRRKLNQEFADAPAIWGSMTIPPDVSGSRPSAPTNNLPPTQGQHFTAADRARILDIWKEARHTREEDHDDYLRLHLTGSHHIHITRNEITYALNGLADEQHKHDIMRASALHARELWGGSREVFGTDVRDLYWQAAYGLAYGVDTKIIKPGTDPNAAPPTYIDLNTDADAQREVLAAWHVICQTHTDVLHRPPQRPAPASAPAGLAPAGP